eukprot:TRINITY_DN8745_c0_g1_i1.p1 TRINITY_DN8745_c0_g1~~TRINITY_DN8745_c0_g1_i1.p1  ORF type:complete len:938 (+),score=262.27 TRINITY_DN8745_c0_g1_i1:310-2814(+)
MPARNPDPAATPSVPSPALAPQGSRAMLRSAAIRGRATSSHHQQPQAPTAPAAPAAPPRGGARSVHTLAHSRPTRAEATRGYTARHRIRSPVRGRPSAERSHTAAQPAPVSGAALRSVTQQQVPPLAVHRPPRRRSPASVHQPRPRAAHTGATGAHAPAENGGPTAELSLSAPRPSAGRSGGSQVRHSSPAAAGLRQSSPAARGTATKRRRSPQSRAQQPEHPRAASPHTRTFRAGRDQSRYRLELLRRRSPPARHRRGGSAARQSTPTPAAPTATPPTAEQKPPQVVSVGCMVKLADVLKNQDYQGYCGGSLRGDDEGLVTSMSEQDGRSTAVVDGPRGSFMYWSEYLIVVAGPPSDMSAVEAIALSLSMKSDEALYGAPDASGEGGYLRQSAGDALGNGRYVLIRCLGRGQSATVWLAHDTCPSDESCPPCVAIKVARCAAIIQKSTDHEIGLLRYVAAESPLAARGLDIGICRLLDYFLHTGPHGVHVCMVFEVLGPTLDALMRRTNYTGLGDLVQVKDILVSILRALDELAVLRVVHTDLKPENILLRKPTASVRKDIAEATGVPYDGPTEPEFPMDEHMVKLSDMGLSYLLQPYDQLKPSGQPLTPDDRRLIWATNYKKGAVCQTREYRAPEIIIGDHFTPETDIWSLGCIAFELLTGRFLFDPKVRAHVTDEHTMDIQHLSEMTQVLGYLGVGDPPAEMTQGYGMYLEDFYDRDSGEFIHEHVESRADVAENLEQRLSGAERDSFIDFLRCALRWRPQQRPTASELLQHEFLLARAQARPPPPTPVPTPAPTPRPEAFERAQAQENSSQGGVTGPQGTQERSSAAESL